MIVNCSVCGDHGYMHRAGASVKEEQEGLNDTDVIPKRAEMNMS